MNSTTPPMPQGPITALFQTFGCKLNFAETSNIAAMMAQRGITRVSPPHHADGEASTDLPQPDIIVVNSCSVTEEADKKCRQAIRSLHRRYPLAAIMVTGCYAQLKADEVAALPGVAIVAGNDRKGLLAQYIDSWIANRQANIHITPARNIKGFTPACSRGDRTRHFLKVQDGCDYFCSYCTIPMARGASRSGTIEEMVNNARQAAAEGGKEIVITGVNIGDFGRKNNETFFDLMRRLDEVQGIERFRISSIEPNLLTDDMIKWVATESQRFMPHFHIPLQSGDDDVLRLMRRRYDTHLYRHRISTIRALMPHAFIGVDLIVGARGETEQRFINSMNFVESLPISRIHVFPYSERPGTYAVTHINDYIVSQAEKHRRSHLINELSQRKLTQFCSKFEGTTRPVLVEHTQHAGGTLHGFTDNYIKVRLNAATATPNTIVNIKLGSFDGEEMTGEPLL